MSHPTLAARHTSACGNTLRTARRLAGVGLLLCLAQQVPAKPPAKNTPAAKHTPASARAAAPARSESDILKDSKPEDWRALDPQNTLVMEVQGTQVLIELAPRFAPRHVDNIRLLARNGFYSKGAILRVQDNYVTQWGDPNEEDPARALPLGNAQAHLPAEFATAYKGLSITRLKDADGWAPVTGWVGSMPVAARPASNQAWIAHCYGVVGAGRDNAADSSNGSSLYAVIGQSPRRLDRNITVVGRVLKGMEALSALPRGNAVMGFYAAPQANIPLGPVQLLADIAPAQRPALEVLRTDTATWAALVEATRNPGAEWFVYRPGHTNICNRSIPTRPMAQ